MKKNIILLLAIFSVLLSAFAFAAQTCVYNTTTKNSTDILLFNTTDYFLLGPVGADITLDSVINITPRLSFNITYNESFVAGGVGSTYTLYLKNIDNSTEGYNFITLYNASNIIQKTGNYTMYNHSGGVWTLNMTNASWSGTTLNIVYNRTWVKNVDNLVIPGDIIEPTYTNTFVQQNTTAGYGKAVGIRLNSVIGLGGSLNLTNWAAEWSYINRTCTDTPLTTSCGSTKVTIFAGFALVAVGLIVVAAFGIVNLFSNTGGDITAAMTMIAIGTIGTAIVIMVGYVIISQVSNLVCL